MAQYDVDLRDYWRILRKRRALVLIMIILVGGFSYLFAKLREPVPFYEAQAAVKINQSTNMMELFSGGFWDPAESIDTQAVIIRSFPVLVLAAEALGWIPSGISEDAVREETDHLAEVKRLKSMVTTSQEGRTDILNISVTSPSPSEAAAVANTLAEVYRRYNIQEKNREVFETRRFIEEQLRITETRLHSAELALRGLKETQNLVALQLQTDKTVNLIFEIQSEYDQIRSEKSIIAAQLGTVEQAEETPEQLGGIFLPGEGTTHVLSLTARLRDLVMKRKTLLFEFTEKHPRVLEIDDQIQALIFGIKTELTSRVAGLQAMEDDLAQKLNRLNADRRGFPEKALQLNRLQREVSLQESLYSQLKMKNQEVQIQAAGGVETVSLVRPADVPRVPFNIPSKLTIVATGVILGLFIGVVFAFVAETLDTSIGTIEDVESLLHLPVIGVIPYHRSEDRDGRMADDTRQADLVVHYEPNSPIAEAFRSIRTHLGFQTGQLKGLTFLITSAFLQEGKTFNAVNIATSLAQAGKRILLIEADLRNPTIHQVFGLHRHPGLTDFVLGGYSVEEVIQTITDVMVGKMDIEEVLMTPGLDNLHFLLSGGTNPHPSEILGSGRFSELLETVREEYDVILVDMPPVLPVADTVDLAPQMDGTILAYSAGKIGRNVLKRAKSALEHGNARLLGVILNNVRPETGPDYLKYHSKYYFKETQSDSKRRRWGIPGRGARPFDIDAHRLRRMILLGLLLASLAIYAYAQGAFSRFLAIWSG